MKIHEYTALLKAALVGDESRARELAACAEANLKRNGQHAAAKQIRYALQTPQLKPLPLKECSALVETPPICQLTDLVVTKPVREGIESLLLEQRSAERLHAAGFLAASRVLLHGPPGTGKTSLAHAVAAELHVPLLVATAEEIWDSYLGATSKKLLDVFRVAGGRRCVLLLDEADVLFAQRTASPGKESTECARITSTSLTQIPALPDSTILFAATNLIERVDHAISRRFDVVLGLSAPPIAALRAFAIELASRHEVSIDGLELGENFSTAKQAVLSRAKQRLLIQATA